MEIPQTLLRKLSAIMRLKALRGGCLVFHRYSTGVIMFHGYWHPSLYFFDQWCCLKASAKDTMLQMEKTQKLLEKHGNLV